jgi:hypothetical protein
MMSDFAFNNKGRVERDVRQTNHHQNHQFNIEKPVALQR